MSGNTTIVRLPAVGRGAVLYDTPLIQDNQTDVTAEKLLETIEDDV